MKHPFPDAEPEQSASLDFVPLESSLRLKAALDLLPPPSSCPTGSSGVSHLVVVKREVARRLSFLIDAELFRRLLMRLPSWQLNNWTVDELLNLKEGRQARELEPGEPPTPGSVVISEGLPIAYVGYHEPPSWLRELLREVSELGDTRLGTSSAGGLTSRSGDGGRVDRPDSDSVEEILGRRRAEVDSKDDMDHVADGVDGVSAAEPLPTRSAPFLAASSEPPRRRLNAHTPARVGLGERTFVYVQASVKAVEATSDRAAATQDLAGFSGELTIDLLAPSLAAEDSLSATLNVPQDGESTLLRFGLRATKAGRHEIQVMAWHRSALVAGLTLWVAVGLDVAVDRSEASGDLDVRTPVGGEYTLDVTWEEDSNCYRFQLRSDEDVVWPPMRSRPLVGDRSVSYKQTLDAVNAQARNLHRLEPEDQARWLRGLGKVLFEELLPRDLQDLMVEHQDRIKLLNIVSSPDGTPWELLHVPGNSGGKVQPLASLTTVARWRYGSAPGRRLRPSKPCVVLPAGSPAAALRELEAVRATFCPEDVRTIEALRDLNRTLDEGEFGLLHFASHNVLEPDDVAGTFVPFGKQRWDLLMLADVPDNHLRSHRPLVFMNACTSAGTAPLYTELSSWAERFLRCGAGAFIGTLWEIRDQSAAPFAMCLYEQLKGGSTIGEAMQAARAVLRKDNEGDPSPFAYTLYGSPLARWEVKT